MVFSVRASWRCLFGIALIMVPSTAGAVVVPDAGPVPVESLHLWAPYDREALRDAVREEVESFYARHFPRAYGMDTDALMEEAVNKTVDALFPVVEYPVAIARETHGVELPVALVREAVRDALLGSLDLFRLCRDQATAFDPANPTALPVAPEDEANGALDVAYNDGSSRTFGDDPTCLLALTAYTRMRADSAVPLAAAVGGAALDEDGPLALVHDLQEYYLDLLGSGDPFNLFFKSVPELVKGAFHAAIDDETQAVVESFCANPAPYLDDPREWPDPATCPLVLRVLAEGPETAGGRGGFTTSGHRSLCGNPYDKPFGETESHGFAVAETLTRHWGNEITPHLRAALVTDATAYTGTWNLRRDDCVLFLRCPGTGGTFAHVVGRTQADATAPEDRFEVVAAVVTSGLDNNLEARYAEYLLVEDGEDRTGEVDLRLRCYTTITRPEISVGPAFHPASDHGRQYPAHVVLEAPDRIAYPADRRTEALEGVLVEQTARYIAKELVSLVTKNALVRGVLTVLSNTGIHRLTDQIGRDYEIVGPDQRSDGRTWGVRFAVDRPTDKGNAYGFEMIVRPDVASARASGCASPCTSYLSAWVRADVEVGAVGWYPPNLQAHWPAFHEGWGHSWVRGSGFLVQFEY